MQTNTNLILPLAKKILKELNPVYAKEQERDEAIDNISGRMDRIEDILARLENRLGTQNQ